MRQKIVGFVGWRGLVGSVLLQRMKEMNDFNALPFTPLYFSTSSAGLNKGPNGELLKNAFNISDLAECDILLTCQGSDWTRATHSGLRNYGWQGIFIDASSYLRMNPETVLVLDPLNKQSILDGLKKGIKDFAGGNCVTSLMLLALQGLFKEGLIEWVHSATYQAASGAGARHMIELIRQMQVLGLSVVAEEHKLSTLKTELSALEIDQIISKKLESPKFPCDNFGVPLASSLIPFIGNLVDGDTDEELKGQQESRKILGDDSFTVDMTCVRIGAMRSHSQALLFKVKKNDMSLEDIHSIIASGNEWVKVVNNSADESKKLLSPVAVSGTLDILIGRLRKSKIPNCFKAFT
jgi:aspartate-semialdehyde dehydrogenase